MICGHKMRCVRILALGTSTLSPSSSTVVDRHDNSFGVESGLVFFFLYSAAIRAHIITRCVNCVHALHAIALKREFDVNSGTKSYDSLLNEWRQSRKSTHILDRFLVLRCDFVWLDDDPGLLFVQLIRRTQPYNQESECARRCTAAHHTSQDTIMCVGRIIVPMKWWWKEEHDK